VRKHPDIYQRIIAEGHSVGNHTNNHLNGWKVHKTLYIGDIQQACDVIKSDLFRPPYGRIKRAVIRRLQGESGSPKVRESEDSQRSTVNGQRSTVNGLSSPVNRLPSKVVMWTVLAGDFDIKISREKCLKNVLDNTGDGSIVVFHDSTKAWGHMSYALPYVLAHFVEEGYIFEKIS
jgi:peptidoglycan/xylan/chitin deacetylase (PgdA/CDA1 family)